MSWRRVLPPGPGRRRREDPKPKTPVFGRVGHATSLVAPGKTRLRGLEVSVVSPGAPPTLTPWTQTGWEVSATPGPPVGVTPRTHTDVTSSGTVPLSFLVHESSTRVIRRA